jgi:citrate synthase
MSFQTIVTPEMTELAEICRENTGIPRELYAEYDIKKGLRDVNGTGVRAGLTNISNIVSFKNVDGKRVPCPGELYYRGMNINDLTQGFLSENRFGFEEITYLLLFGALPTKEQLDEFCELLANQRALPKNFTRDVIMKAPAHDMMNTLSRSVLTLYYYDKNADDISLPNVLRQCLNLIAVFPMLSVYGYHAYNHDQCGKSLYIHAPRKKLSAAENILRMLRPDKQYTDFEAKVLDLALVLHAEHGGGNNSTFTTHVVTSSGTDTYSTIAAALGSLKGRSTAARTSRSCGCLTI